MASLASTISAALSKANIKTVDEFASAVELSPGFVANLLRNEGVQAQAQRLHSEMSTMTDTVVLDVATQTALTGDVVDVSTAEAMVEEALCMVAEAEEGERAAQKCAREWLDRAELGTALLRKAEERTDWAQRERRAAQALATAEQAARHMAEQLLAAEAALADAAVESTLHECAARRQAEAQRDIYQALAGAGRGGRGSRGGRGTPPPPVPEPPPPPPPPPPPAELIQRILAVPVAMEGQMSDEEALAILNVTEKSSRWLLLHLRPDKHPHHEAQAEAALSRVNQARDVRCRHV